MFSNQNQFCVHPIDSIIINSFQKLQQLSSVGYYHEIPPISNDACIFAPSTVRTGK